MTLNEHSASIVIQWLRDTRTLKQLIRLWDELSAYSQNLSGVVDVKNEMKEKLK